MNSFNNHKFESLDSDVESRLIDFYDKSGSSSKTQKLPDYLVRELNTERNSITTKSLHSQGGSKEIYKVHDARTDRNIAFARLKPGATSRQMERFLNEARIAASLEHPNIVPIYDIGLDENQEPFFSMKFLRDQSLSKIIKELRKDNPEFQKKYPQNILLDIFIKVCDAVDYAHSQDIIHLDLKPENIMIGEYGEVYVCDWGLARILQQNHEDVDSKALLEIDMVNDYTLSGVIKGTPGFMAPEQIDSRFGKKGKRTDTYALGAILYSILTLSRPFSEFIGKRVLENTAHGKLKEPKAIKNSISNSLNAVVIKAMSVKKHNRYAKVSEIINEIRAFQLGFATEAERVGFIKRLFLFIKRHKAESFLIFVVIAIVCGSFIMLQNRAEEMRRSLDLYEHEKKVRREQLLKSTPALLSQWWRNFAEMDSRWLHVQLHELAEISPNNDRIKFFNAILYLTELNFEKAEKIVKSTKRSEISEEALRILEISKLCRIDQKKYGYIKVETAIKCLDVTNFGKYLSAHARIFLGAVFGQLKSDKEKNKLLKLSLGYWKESTPIIKDNSVTTFEGQVKVNLQGLDMPDLFGIEYFPIQELDLSNSSIRNYPTTGNKHIEFLNLSGCNKLDALNGLRRSVSLKKVVLPAKKRGSSIANFLRINEVKVEFSKE